MLFRSCYKLGDLGKAILNYERSLKLDPHFESAKENLNFLYSQTTDKIEPIEHFFFHEWLIMLGNQLTSNQWAILSIITFILALILLLLYLFSKIRLLRKMAFFIGIFSFLLSVSSMSYAFVIKNNNEHHPSAIIMVGSASVKSAPDNSGTELFVLHEGSKVLIKSRVGKWVEVKIADGNVGWLPAVDMSVI